MFKNLFKSKTLRIIFEMWLAGFAYFTFTVFVQVYFLGIIILISLSDTFILDRKGLIRNLIINTIIFFSFDFLCEFLFLNFSIRIGDAFVFMIYDIILSYAIFNKITKLRVDNLEYI